MANYEKLTEKLVDWIRNKVRDAHAKGAVVGLSGGIDSSVTAVLCKKAFPDSTLGIIMPCYSNPQDEEDARLVAETFDIPYKVVHLEKTFDALRDAIGGTEKLSQDNLALANIKPRLRMTTLYYFASLYNALVVGTDNRSELTVGYFTKYGDGGIDLAPLGNLVKTQVRELARHLGIPERIITKAPSAGLWENQTDEAEMGITYEELDHYILTGEAEPRVKEVVDRLHARSLHKLQPPPIPNFGVE
ncbi:NAD(+) synthase [Anoxybacter fermentans]|uniref:NH(3)-dependent NAD(+) synthetase n=1 Tax=Anoxybacter fermentans TaxID=1323375 RepID=A0A3Q9HRS1_9FIRM|nr:NAD+ synthase [Anoxybacter fermentans]AZR74129.1 NAD(+) synthase [Anoxybacter fermentans]